MVHPRSEEPAGIEPPNRLKRALLEDGAKVAPCGATFFAALWFG